MTPRTIGAMFLSKNFYPIENSNNYLNPQKIGREKSF